MPIFEKMPPKARKKDKLTEKPDKPPHNSPHHRTSNPSTSAMRPGSDAGIDPLPSASLKPAPSKRTTSTRPLSQQPSRPYSPRPGTRRSSASAAPQNGGKRESKGVRRAVSHDMNNNAIWREMQEPDSQNMKRPFSHEPQPRGHRRVDNISQATNVNQLPHPFAAIHTQGLREPVFVPTHTIPSFTPHSTWPEIFHSQESPFGPLLPPDQERELLHQRQRYLKYYKTTLKISTIHALLSESVAPLNPVLAVPPPPYCLIGTMFERWFEDSNWMMNWRFKKSALPGLVWDVRYRPDVYGDEGLGIAAWPYARNFEDSEREGVSEMDMRTRMLLGESEVRRVCGQTVTNPPSSFVTICVTEAWSIRVRSPIPGRWVSVQDVLNAVYTALNVPIHPLDLSAHIAPAAKHDSSSISGGNAAEVTHSLPTTRLSTLKSGHHTWVGLRRDRAELVDGPAVRELVTGEVDGGTWWLVLRKP